MKSTVLVVVSDLGALDYMAGQLIQEGYRVLTATQGAHALKLAQRDAPDVILLGGDLQDLDDQAVFDLLKRLPSTRHVPVLMASGIAASSIEAAQILDHGQWRRRATQWRDLLACMRSALVTSARERDARIGRVESQDSCASSNQREKAPALVGAFEDRILPSWRAN